MKIIFSCVHFNVIAVIALKYGAFITVWSVVFALLKNFVSMY